MKDENTLPGEVVKVDVLIVKRAAKMLLKPIVKVHAPILNACRCEMPLLSHWFISAQK